MPDARNIQVNCYNLKLSALQGIIQEGYNFTMNLLELKNSKCYFAKHYQRKVNSFTLAFN